MIGKEILHYKILEKLGEGGMGIVYKAEDSRLNRQVAIKVLPPHLLIAQDDRARFQREAKAAAALNHAAIATVYEINEFEGAPFIAMEYVEGKTLNHHIEKGPLPLKDAINVAIRVAEGLKAAHAKGIVHRDIKSSNIILDPEMQAKILDFGLAKTSMSTRLTQMGSTIGTMAYMSPEQVNGQDVDQRSDLWSLGVVLYEMISGRLPFRAEYDQAILFAILNEQPQPLTALRTGVPMSLEWIVNKLMAKDPAERYQNANDLIIDLKAVDLKSSGFSRVSTASAVAQPTTAQTVQISDTEQRQKRFPQSTDKFAWIAVGVLALAVIVLSILYFMKPALENRTIRAVIEAPENIKIAFETGGLEGGHLALSPNGKLLAFVGQDSAGRSSLWVRRLDALTAQNLNGTEGAYYPFWSADSRYIGFFADGKLKKINAAGGPVLSICDAARGRGGTWNSDDVVVFTPEQEGGIFRVSANGGSPQQITRMDSTSSEQTHRWASFLPDGQHFLYFVRYSGSEQSENDAVYVGSLDGKTRKKIMNVHSNAYFANGYLIYTRDNTLIAQKFDTGSLELTGDAIPLAENIQYSNIFSRGAFTPSTNGLLIYLGGSTRTGQKLVWYDWKGNAGESIGEEVQYRYVSISNDDKKLAISIYDPKSRQSDIWIHDLTRNVRTRFTFSNADEQYGIWSPDNSTIIFNSAQGGNKLDLYQKNASGSGEIRHLFSSNLDKYATDWSKDGKFITFTSAGDPKSKWDLWILPLGTEKSDGQPKPSVFLQTEFNEGIGEFSPDDKWMAYCSDESGQWQIYVRPFPNPGGKWQVSIDGVSDGPYWRGNRIYYSSEKNKLMAANINTQSGTVQVGDIKELFDLPSGASFMTMTSDGKKFLLRIPVIEESSQPLTLISGWPDELRQK